MTKKIKQNGYALVYLIIVIFIFSAMLLPLINLVVIKMKIVATTIDKEEALQVANAGGVLP